MSLSPIHIAFQAVNFLILVFLLNRFLYKPILSVIAERKQKVNRERQTVEAEKQTAEKQKAEFFGKLASLESERISMIERAQREAQAQAAQIQADLEEKLATERARQKALLQTDREQIEQEIRQQTILLSLTIAEQLHKADALESDPLQAVRAVLKKISELPVSEKNDVLGKLRQQGATLLSAKAVSQTAVEQAKAELEKVCGNAVTLVCQVEPSLIFGIELHFGHFSFALHLLAGLEKVKKELFKA